MKYLEVHTDLNRKQFFLSMAESFLYNKWLNIIPPTEVFLHFHSWYPFFLITTNTTYRPRYQDHNLLAVSRTEYRTFGDRAFAHSGENVPG